MKNLFFFFQADDGIRGATVTGVQTCALPISRGLPRMGSPRRTVTGMVTRGCPPAQKTLEPSKGSEIITTAFLQTRNLQHHRYNPFPSGAAGGAGTVSPSSK